MLLSNDVGSLLHRVCRDYYTVVGFCVPTTISVPVVSTLEFMHTKSQSHPQAAHRPSSRLQFGCQSSHP